MSFESDSLMSPFPWGETQFEEGSVLGQAARDLDDLDERAQELVRRSGEFAIPTERPEIFQIGSFAPSSGEAAETRYRIDAARRDLQLQVGSELDADLWRHPEIDGLRNATLEKRVAAFLSQEFSRLRLLGDPAVVIKNITLKDGLRPVIEVEYQVTQRYQGEAIFSELGKVVVRGDSLVDLRRLFGRHGDPDSFFSLPFGGALEFVREAQDNIDHFANPEVVAAYIAATLQVEGEVLRIWDDIESELGREALSKDGVSSIAADFEEESQVFSGEGAKEKGRFDDVMGSVIEFGRKLQSVFRSFIPEKLAA